MPGGRTQTLRHFVLLPLLTRLVNMLLSGARLARDLTYNTLTPIFKGRGSREDLSGYRGIAVGSVLGKVYESVLHKRLTSMVDHLGFRAETQAGFREGRGTLDALFTLQHLADQARVTRRHVYVVFIDFKMAFDICDRSRLVQTWESMGLSGRFLEALKALYDEIHMLVKVRGGLGEPMRTTRGTKQGSELSPLIFGLFIERLRPLLLHLCPDAGPLIGDIRVPEQFYADDVMLAAESPEDMQCLLDALAVFCHLFRMAVNVQKTVGLILRPPGITLSDLLPHCHWQYQGQPIVVADEAKYLGLLFSGTAGASSAAAAALATAGRRVVTWLLARARQLQITQSALLCYLFDTLVDPVVSYGCQVWAPAVCEHLLNPDVALDRKANPAEAAHIDFLRMAAGLPTFSHKWTVLAEYGRRPLLVKWLTLTARFWVRVKGLQPHRLLRQSLIANIELYLQHRQMDSWTGCFLRCLVGCRALTDAQLQACTTVQDVLALPIHDSTVCAALVEHFDGVWVGAATDPRTADSDAVVAATYTQWVRGGTPRGPPPLHTASLGFFVKRTLMRLRTGSFPLRIATGRNESRTPARGEGTQRPGGGRGGARGRQGGGRGGGRTSATRARQGGVPAQGVMPVSSRGVRAGEGAVSVFLPLL